MNNKYIMAEVGTTSIDQLPVNPQMNMNNNNNNPIQLVKSELPNNDIQNSKIQNYGEQLNDERKIDPQVQNIDYSSQLNSVLQEATASGATVLPSRDIPQNTLPRQQDQEIKPNFIPENKEDYIGSILDREKIIQENRQKQNQSDNMDYLYQQLQQPLLISIIYFIFQLPIVRDNMFYMLPKLFNRDGNPGIYGYVIKSLLFGLVYFILIRGMSYIAEF